MYTRKTHGFTLVEILVAVALVGIAFVALIASNRAFTVANGQAIDISTAEFLAEQLRELTAALPVVDPQTTTSTFGPEEGTLAGYDDLDDFDGAVISPPIDAGRVAMSELAAFTQRITVENVSGSDFTQVVGNHTTPFVRVTVDILMNGRTITSTRWIRARLN
ncbi:MAG TPA: type II secretion system protein [Phycisphaerales bacterium]|nr:type II secretion system protein [Phycisphaerales bacterium]